MNEVNVAFYLLDNGRNVRLVTEPTSVKRLLDDFWMYMYQYRWSVSMLNLLFFASLIHQDNTYMGVSGNSGTPKWMV